MADVTIYKHDVKTGQWYPTKLHDNEDGTYSETQANAPIASGPVYTQTIVVAQGQSLSAAVDLGEGYGLVGFIPPAAVEATTTNLSIQASPTAGGTYQTVYPDGVRYSLPFVVSVVVPIQDKLASILMTVRFFKITLETAAGVAVSQATASRTFTIIKRLL